MRFAYCFLLGHLVWQIVCIATVQPRIVGVASSLPHHLSASASGDGVFASFLGLFTETWEWNANSTTLQFD